MNSNQTCTCKFEVGDLVRWNGAVEADSQVCFVGGRRPIVRVVGVHPDGSLVLGSRWLGRFREVGVSPRWLRHV